jgi:virginiamycin B lyase
LLTNTRTALFATLALLCLAACAAAQSGTYSQMSWYPISNPSAFPEGITAGPDGALWFTESGCYSGTCYIGRSTTAGVITGYTLPTLNAGPTSITTGPDGALWFTEAIGQIGRITTAGAVTEYPVPTGNSGPRGITTGPDGALWFTEADASQVGRITTDGVVTEYPVGTPFDLYLEYITAGPEDSLWFTWTTYGEAGAARITTAGVVTMYQIPASYGPFGGAGEIIEGPDHALWLADLAGNIWRMTPAGAFTQYPIPIVPSGGGTGNIANGPDGAMWFTVTCNPCANDQIGRITTAGVITEFPAPGDGSLGGIAAGPDGALWSTDTGFVLSIKSGLFRTPACALGLSASSSGTGLAMNFNLGTATPAIWNVALWNTTAINQSIPAVAPPRAFTLDWHQAPADTNVLVKSELSDSTGQVMCAEWTTVSTAQ